MWQTLRKNACRLGLFQDSDFAVDLEDSKSISESHVRTKKLDRHPAILSVTRNHRLGNHFIGRWMRKWMESLRWTLWDLVIERVTSLSTRRLVAKKVRDTNKRSNETNPSHVLCQRWRRSILSLRTPNSLVIQLTCTSFEGNEPVIKMKKARVRR